ncbi:MAG: LysR family transcriptional regulator [Eggerthellales bacterium]|nr:LysR family transcriptional regulator [Eggerthellales bacterium]
MKIETLEYFLALAKARSMAEAAERTHISQQGFNKAIASIEHDLGVVLVNRSKKGSTLTREGVAFMRYAKRILREYNAAREELSTQTQDVKVLRDYSGRLAVTRAAMVSLSVLADEDLLSRVNLVEVTIDEAFELAMENTCLVYGDFCPLVYPGLRDSFTLTEVGRGDVGIALSKKMLGPQDAGLSAWELVERVPISAMSSSASNEIYDRLFEDHPLKHVFLRSSNPSVIESNLEKGRSAILIDSFTLPLIAPRLRIEGNQLLFKPFENGTYSSFGFLKGIGVETSPIDQAFIDAFVRYFK